MADDFASLAVKLDRLARGVSGRALRAITTNVALAAKKDVEGQVRADLGADMAMSGWRKGKLKFRAGFEIVSDSRAELKARPAGPWRVLEDGRRETAAPKRGRRVRVLKTPAGPRSYRPDRPMRIGATKGKRTFAKASMVIARETPGRVHHEVRQAIADALRG